MKKIILTLFIFVMLIIKVFSQNLAEPDSTSNKIKKQEIEFRHSIGVSLFMLMNLLPDPADYYQLNYGYLITPKDNIIFEAVTWIYYEPLGTYGHSEELYPGMVRAYGVGLGYQRFHWKKLYTSVIATSFIQQFYDINDKKIQKGYQLYLQFHLGYRFEFLKKRLFVEPAYVLKYWPVNTNFPAAFAEIEKGAPKHIFEPSLNFGFKF
jgi:hypothetical protein